MLTLARQLHATTTLSEVMERVMDALGEATRYRRAYLLMPIEGGVGLEVVGYAVADRELVNQRMAEHDWRKDRLLSMAMTADKTLVFPDLRLCEEADQRQVEVFGNRTVIVVPMLRLGERMGCLNIATFAAEGVMLPTPDELAFAEEVAALISVVAGRLRVEEKHRALEASVVREQRLEALGRMAGEVAHDLNNILVPIIGNTELALAYAGEPQKVQGLLGEVRSAADRAARLTRQLLAFSRGQPVERAIVNLDRALTALEPMLRSMLPASVSFQVERRGRPRTVLANAAQLEQVVMNLVLNARDAISGTGAITLVADSAERDGRRWAMLSVEDTGIGMTPEISSRAFDPFFTTKAYGKGTGLGLAVVDGVVRSHGGTVEVDSQPGRGTCFTIYLPEADAHMASLPGVVHSVHGLEGSEHLLVADDDVAVRVLLERVLTGAGYRVTLAQDGEEALEQLAGHPDIALVVADIVMPRLRGDVLVQRLAGRVPVLLISGYAPEQVEVAPGTRVLAKPFANRELLARVREVLAVAPTATG
ncbi:MAG: response regulator [Acidobacteria bacterium]|nr:response regulator [Acidobacteriota bacterium]